MSSKVKIVKDKTQEISEGQSGLIALLQDHALAAPKERDELFAKSCCPALSNDAITAMRQLLDREFWNIVNQANHYADTFWAEKKELEAEEGGVSFIGTRARLQRSSTNQDSLTLEWYRLTKQQNVPAGQEPKLFHNYIRRGQGLRYNRARFRREPSWAQTLINFTEDHYALIRKRLKHLRKMRTMLNQYERMVDEFDTLGTVGITGQIKAKEQIDD